MNCWEGMGSPFSKYPRIKDETLWKRFWDTCPYTEKELYKILRNVCYAVRNGYYESRYISPDPCQFITGILPDKFLGGEDAMRWCSHLDESDQFLCRFKDF